MEEEFIFAMDFEEVNQKMKTIVKKHLNKNLNDKFINSPRYKNNNTIKKRILSCSPNVSFTNYKPPPSSSYNKKLNNLLNLYHLNHKN